MLDFAQARRTMVDSQLRTFDVTDRALLAAMAETPREHFAPTGREQLAYIDRNLQLSDASGPDRVMLTPMIFARLIQALEVESGERALDVGTGYGYGAAVLSRLGASVVALESDAALADTARERLAADGRAVEVETGSLKTGCPARGPFDAILVNGAVTGQPAELLGQLKDGGRLACLLAGEGPVRAVVFIRSGDAFGSRFLLDAMAPIIPEFRPEPGFVF